MEIGGIDHIIKIDCMPYIEAVNVAHRIITTHWPDFVLDETTELGILERFYYKTAQAQQSWDEVGGEDYNLPLLITVIANYEHEEITIVYDSNKDIVDEIDKEISLMLTVNEID